MERTQGIDFSWLLALRWGAMAGQIVIVLVVDRIMDIALPLGPLAVIIGIEAASNVAGELWRRRAAEIQEWTLGAVMLLDVVLLTVLLYLTGGPFNPFSFLYLVNIALAAVVLRPPWTWTLVAFSFACFGALFLAHMPLPVEHAGGHEHPIFMHLQGMWVAFGVAAAFIVYFIQRVTRALAVRDAELAAARSLTARHEKLASFATLAAGAAHELATPLSTIAVAAKELERQLGSGGSGPDTAADARLIRQQVERCRAILTRMATEAGESAGEAIVAVAIEELVAAATDELPAGERVRRTIEPAARGRMLRVPPRALVQALRGVVKNALEATAAGTEVRLSVTLDAGAWSITVRDAGAGMTPDVLVRAGEPFFTTKNGDSVSRGMGLGLFLTRAVLERLGGRLELDSRPGHGTTATLVLPVDGAATLCRIAGAPEDATP